MLNNLWLFKTLTIITICSALGCKWNTVEDPSTFGPWAVGFTSYEINDPDRDGRKLLISVWYPVDAENAPFVLDIDGLLDGFPYPKTIYPLFGSFGLEADAAYEKINIAVPSASTSDWSPSAEKGRNLIVFSHGYGGTNTQSTPLMETLASHGFIVASPEHTGNSASGASDPYEVVASNRVPDVSFVIDTLLARSADPEDVFFERINPLSIGVIGHSFGGTTTIGTAIGFAGASYDPRVKAIMPISAAVERSFTAQELSAISLPTLLMGGTLDEAVPIANNIMVFDAIENLPDDNLGMNSNTPPVYQIDIIGATHTHFANVCAIGNFLLESGFELEDWSGLGAGDLLGPYSDTCNAEALPIENVVRLQNLYAVAFFKTYLRSELDNFQYLTRQYAESNEPDIMYFSKNNLLDMNE